MAGGWMGGWIGGYLEEIMPLRGFILQAGTCQILNLPENPGWSWMGQFHKERKITTPPSLFCCIFHPNLFLDSSCFSTKFGESKHKMFWVKKGTQNLFLMQHGPKWTWEWSLTLNSYCYPPKEDKRVWLLWWLAMFSPWHLPLIQNIPQKLYE